MDKIFTYTLIHATLRGSIPILYAAMACAITYQANVINIGVEGIMLISSFFAIYTSYMIWQLVHGFVSSHCNRFVF